MIFFIGINLAFSLSLLYTAGSRGALPGYRAALA